MVRVLVLLWAFACVAASPAPGQVTAPETPAGRQLAWLIGAINGADPGQLEDRFTDEFQKAVPPAQLKANLALIGNQLFKGPVELVRVNDGASENDLVAIVRGTDSDVHGEATISVEPASGRVQGMFVRLVPGMGSAAPSTWEALDAALGELPGDVSVGAYELVHEGDAPTLRPVHALHADTRLAIGSTFKLYILGALGELVLEGGASWDEMLAIREEAKSLPSGVMQTNAAGTEFRIREYAGKMISISDNTATDHLLYRVGRERVESYMARLHGEPALNRPFLATLEMFKIKLGPDRTLAARYAAADEAERRAMLEPGGEVQATTPNLLAASVWKKPVAIDRVEWFASAEELCRVMADLHRIEGLPGAEALGEALRINPGIGFDRQNWKSIAYKGGSEPGVINLTWLVERADGRWFTVSFGWNDTEDAVDDARAVELAGSIFRVLAGYR